MALRNDAVCLLMFHPPNNLQSECPAFLKCG